MFNYKKEILELKKLNELQKIINLAEEYLIFFPNSFFLLQEIAISYYYLSNNIENIYKGLEYLNIIIEKNILTEKNLKLTISNKKFFLKKIEKYEENFNIEQDLKIPLHSFPMITFTITTSNRLDLFIKTMNCFLKNCSDKHLIHQYICIDDNSLPEERFLMQKHFPFFNFIFKTPEEKGHYFSMKMILEMVKTPFLLHFEDDRMLIDKKCYLRQMMEILTHDENLGQVCFNHNYAETLSDNIKGGILKQTENFLYYYEHEYIPGKKSNYQNCYYYPHFTLSPSLISTKIFKDFQFENIPSFEFNFGLKYSQKYKTAFLPGFHVKHIGRLTSEKNCFGKINAYDILNTVQFSENKKFESFLINLEKRKDRLEKINFSHLPENIQLIKAIDGFKLQINPRLRSFCLKNNFLMRPGVIGCALTHLLLYQKLLDSENDGYIIFEDDISTDEKLNSKINRVFKILEFENPDIIFFTTCLISKNFEKETKIVLYEKLSDIRNISYGGTGGYYISRKGALQVLNFIDTNTLTEAIDAILFQQVDKLKIYFVLPPLFEQNIYGDTDIQHDFYKSSHLFEKDVTEKEISNFVIFNHEKKNDLFQCLKFMG
jgi:GR25 family glycosyltransferase involved in LPS biosynthesis